MSAFALATASESVGGWAAGRGGLTLVRLAQERVQDRLPLGHGPVAAFELAIFPERVDLVQGELERVQVARREGTALLRHLDCRTRMR